MIVALEWKDDHLRILDQTRLPAEKVFIDLFQIEDVFQSIRKLKIRGAPLIGIAAAYGLYLGMKDEKVSSVPEFFELLNKKIEYLSSARPTAVNLFWALVKIKEKLKQISGNDVQALKKQLLKEAQSIHEDDRWRCQQIGLNGQEILPEPAHILTICNTGILATGGIGTALGVVYTADEMGKEIQVYACETRPLLQGARLTVWELTEANIPVTLITDSMAAWLMKNEKVNCVIVGADRIARDGSTANKIGTYMLALLANYHRIPFYVAAPLSTFDFNINSGSEIPIEYRDCEEIRKVFRTSDITVPTVPCWNPAFDITPPELISGFITEKGIIQPPFENNIKQLIYHYETHN